MKVWVILDVELAAEGGQDQAQLVVDLDVVWFHEKDHLIDTATFYRCQSIKIRWCRPNRIWGEKKTAFLLVRGRRSEGETVLPVPTKA